MSQAVVLANLRNTRRAEQRILLTGLVVSAGSFSAVTVPYVRSFARACVAVVRELHSQPTSVSVLVCLYYSIAFAACAGVVVLHWSFGAVRNLVAEWKAEEAELDRLAGRAEKEEKKDE